MSLRKINASEVSSLALDPIDDKTLAQVREILDKVKSGGEDGLLAEAVRLGDLPSLDSGYIVEADELKKAFDALSDLDRQTLSRTASRIREFALAQRNSVSPVRMEIPGGFATQNISAVDTAGCYAPGGRYPLPSSVLMTAITARVAGVKNVWVASPKPHPATLAAAYIAGADGFLACGGAQAIGAFAYGIDGQNGSIPKCDVIVGPGNRWVTAAKKLVYGVCAIDMLAGPSECLVLADHTANPAIVAADLLAQAEHDTDALPILVTTDESLAEKVNAECEVQLSSLSTSSVAREALSKGFYVFCKSMDEAVKVANFLGPEHLEVHTENSDSVASQCTDYGGIFIGSKSAEVLGDYGAGPNHVLPTSGSARYSGGLSVFTFLRIRTGLRLYDADSPKQREMIEDCVRLARIEGLEGHARAAEKRLSIN